MKERLDRILMARHPDFSRARLEGLIKANRVFVNGVCAAKAGQKVSETDEIRVEIPPPVPATPEAEDIPLDILFEDADMLVLDKPAGLVVHPAPGHQTGTLVNALLHHCPNLSGIGGVARPGIVHRLDQDTSGLLVVAKSQKALEGLAKAFASHRNVEKTYVAICHGAPRLDAGTVDTLIGRHPVNRKKMAVVEANGKRAVTHWRVLLKGLSPQKGVGVLSLVECRIETGRTHQIRVHLAFLGCPVVGDALYGKSALDGRMDPTPRRQLLHAARLRLFHPVTGARLSFEAPLPQDFADVLATFADGGCPHLFKLLV